MSCGLVVLVEGGAVGMTMCCGGGSGRACFDLSIITVYISLSSSTKYCSISYAHNCDDFLPKSSLLFYMTGT